MALLLCQGSTTSSEPKLEALEEHTRHATAHRPQDQLGGVVLPLQHDLQLTSLRQQQDCDFILFFLILFGFLNKASLPSYFV